KIVISHVDSPRLDLKQIPLFEDKDSNLALLETHYYGGIKKFQWLTIPLALHGIIIKKDGEKLNFHIGEDPKDPVFTVADILPHLSYDVQDKKKLRDAIQGESLDIVIGSKPLDGDDKNKIKDAILEKLHTDYGIVEEDFVSADLEAVPAYQPRDVGFDRSMIGSYGQDDRVCAYTSLQAILAIQNPEYTAIALFVDKEEIGSEGNTSAQVIPFLRTIIKQLDSSADIDNVMLHSKVLSADVDAAVTPNYKEVFELKNASTLGDGVSMSKYTGHGGKAGANDAPAEYVGEIRQMLNAHNIPWQTGELGKVDKGGGGTVAKFFSRMGMTVLDLGPPVLSMHSPFEVTSKVDVYASFLAYQAFLSST
ncbi:MAG: aminopeptidase, partial [Thermoplasmatota archaeon]